jgi:hypothetical protein
MSSRPVWPQPPAPPQKTPLSAVPPAPLTRVGNLSRPSYIEQLRQLRPAQVAPYVELLKSTPNPDAPQPLATDRPLREALIQLLAHTLATGREMISGRELFWRLQVPPQREKQLGRDIARVLRSLGWTRCRTGKAVPGGRIWGWRWREWSVSSVALPTEAIVHEGDVGHHPLPVRAKRAPIIAIYGDDVPVYEATPEGIWAVIKYPLGPRLKIEL